MSARDGSAVPVGPEPQALSVGRLAEIAAELGHVEQVAAEATGWRLEEYQAVRGALRSARLLVTEAGRLRARVAELEADDVSPQVRKLRALLAGQRAATETDPGRRAAWRMLAEPLEDPHDSPLHHDYRVPRDLPETGGGA